MRWVKPIFHFLVFRNILRPNNDGYHDRWKPYDIPDPDFRLKGIYIYDRYGKLLVELPYGSPGWDGTFNGRPMPSNDYWFNATMQNGEIFKGHFTLKR